MPGCGQQDQATLIVTCARLIAALSIVAAPVFWYLPILYGDGSHSQVVTCWKGYTRREDDVDGQPGIRLLSVHR